MVMVLSYMTGVENMEVEQILTVSSAFLPCCSFSLDFVLVVFFSEFLNMNFPDFKKVFVEIKHNVCDLSSSH